ncbi:unnamed protein product [Larinioides sclopetarius]|uniref:Uncharacterized protein n=1 Tax=Larinioides sclopetarius TaxID=280406 RepID=A0AAV2AXB7_9ARAC
MEGRCQTLPKEMCFDFRLLYFSPSKYVYFKVFCAFDM